MGEFEIKEGFVKIPKMPNGIWYDENKLIYHNGSTEDPNKVLREMRQEAEKEFRNQPVDRRMSFVYDYLMKKIIKLKMENGDACPNVSECSAFVLKIVESVEQQVRQNENR